MSQPIRYLLTYDVAGALRAHPIAGLSGEHLSWERLARARFAVFALNGSHPVGLIIGEIPHGIPGFRWLRHVGDVVEVGGLSVDPVWRRAGIARRLTTIAVDEVRALGRIPVAVTEAQSVSDTAARADGAEERHRFTVDGQPYIPWVLRG